MRLGGNINTVRNLLALLTALLLILLPVHAHGQRFGTDGNTRYGVTAAKQRLNARYDPFNSVWQEQLIRFERNDFAPRGIRAGQFYLFPSVHTLLTYDTNVFADGTNPVSDTRYDISPVLRIRSDFARHVLDMAVGATYSGFAENNQLNHFDPFANMRWRYDLTHDMALSGTASVAIDHDDFVSPERPDNAAEPIRFFENKGSINFRRDVARFNFGLGAVYQHRDFDDVRGNDGSIVDQDIRDFREYGIYTRVGYEFSPGYSLITRLRGYHVDNYGATTLDRTANGVEAQAGIDFELTPLLRVKLLGGYDVRTFETGDFNDTATVTFDGKLKWLMTPLITINAAAGRNSKFTTTGVSSQRTDTDASIDVEYRMWRNLTLHFGASATFSEFEGSDREDVAYTGKIGIEYLLNRNLQFTLDYDHRTYESNDNSYDYDRDRIRFGVKVQF